jgi:lipopolysaccharide/colanic/teichoic acid biosynthesis glycosyltransferase
VQEFFHGLQGELRVLLKMMASAERLGAVVAICVLLPFLALVGGIIFLLSGRSPLVAHKRLGHLGMPLRMLKFRTMWSGQPDRGAGLIEILPDEGVPELKTAEDPRVTSRFARFCRKHSIDELPQLWHVARGEMSLVGPRPVTPAEWSRYYGPHSAEVLHLKPGMSGLWQIRGRNRLNYRQRRRLDMFLARHYCLWLYLRIVGRTLPNVFAGRNAW